MYEVTITTEDVSETYELQADGASQAEAMATDLFEADHGRQHSFHEFKVEVR